MKKFNEYLISLMNQKDEFQTLNPSINEDGSIEMGNYCVYLREEDGYSIMGIHSDSAQSQELWEYDKLTTEEEIFEWICFLKNEYDTNESLMVLGMETDTNPFGEEGITNKWLLPTESF